MLRVAFLATLLVAIAEWLGLCFLIVDLDPTSMDIGGHIASAALFGAGRFHLYDDTFFLGGVQNLFYPPLEDALVALIEVLTPGDYVRAYKLYLAAIVLAFFAAAYRLSLRFVRLHARIFFLLSLLFVFNAEKPGLTHYQGLGVVDILVTGLSSELLGGVFLLLLLDELWGRQRANAIALLTALVAISHLVILGAVLVLGLVLVLVDRKSAAAMAFGLLLASFTLVPMIAYGEHLARSTIDLLEPIGFFSVSALGVATMARDRRVGPVLAAAGLLFLAVLSGTTMAPYLGWVPRPSFHYYRLASVALLLLLAGVSAIVDRAGERSERPWKARGLLYAVTTAAVLFASFDLAWPKRVSRSFRAEATFDSARTWVIEQDRAGSSGIASTLSVQRPGFRSAVGLYWESSRDNALLNSYLATVLYPPVVMSYVHYRAYACEIRRCLVDQIIRDYDVRRIALDVTQSPVYLTSEEHACFRQMTTEGRTRDFELERTGLITVGSLDYAVFDVKGHHVPAEIIGFDQVRPIEATPEQPEHQGYLVSAFEACRAGQPMTEVYLHDRDYRKFQGVSEAAANTGDLTFSKKGDTYSIWLSASAPVPFRVKLSYMPGLHLIGEDGGELPLLDGYPHLVGIGRGPMTLEYRRPMGMWIGYAMSLVSWLYLLARIRKRS